MAGQTHHELNTPLTQIAMAVRPKGLIWDKAVPEVQVFSRSFEYRKFDTAQAFTVPETQLGRKSTPNQVEFDSSLVTAKVDDHGLLASVAQSDVDDLKEQGNLSDLLGIEVEQTSHLVLLKKEQITADFLQGENNYATDNRLTLASGDKWSNADADIVGFLLDTLDRPLLRPNKMTISQQVWTKMRQNASIVEAIKGTGAGSGARGVVSLMQVAELLEIDEICIGRTFSNDNARGQSPSLTRLWDNHVSLVHFNEAAVSANSQMATFGFRARYKQPMRVSASFEQQPGTDGVHYAKVVDQYSYVSSYPELGILVKDVL